MIKISVIVVSLLFLNGCSQKNIKDHEIKCKNPRPSICTMQYQPVCGRVDTKIRCIKPPCPSEKFKTFSNACVACSNKSVYGYTNGKCKQELLKQ